ncbi:MAG TPA: ATP-binding protein [Terriglobales bacterium]|nr:ATP-binding protein [Terriglobales bacterium]
MFLVMRQSVHTAVDDELAVRFNGVQRFVQRVFPGSTVEDVRYEFREHSGMKPGGDLLQISDARGNWIFQSGSIRPYNIPVGSPQTNRAELKTIDVASSPLRILTARVQADGQQYIVQLATPLGGFYGVLHRFGWLILWSVPAVLIVATVSGYWMSRRALAPVDQITNTARSISGHNLSQRLAVPETGDELQRLSETLNDMMARLDTAFKRLDAAYKKIVRFTADASHELRTPVALVRTTTEVALQKSRTAPEYEEVLRGVLAESERTSVLLDDLMTLARADSGAATLQVSDMDLGTAVKESCSQGSTLAGPRNVAFDWQVPEQPMNIKGDPNALRQLFLILIDNALKYTPSGGRVSVGMHQVDGFGIVEVRDTGIGIAAEDLPNIFERFYRADKVRSRDMGGVGLGLSIAQWIAEAHGANIQVESAPGQGSVFRVSIPLNSIRTSVPT